MSASIPGTSVCIASSLVSAGAADALPTASESAPAREPRALAATPAFEQGRTLARIVQGGGGKPEEGASSPITPLQKAVLFFAAAAAAVTAAWLALRGKETGAPAPLKPVPDPKDAEMAAIKAKAFDATHLERYPYPLRSNIIGEWMTLGDEDKLFALRREFNLRNSDLHPLPMVPPRAWAASVAALFEQETALKATANAPEQGVSSSDAERHQRQLAAANGLREIGEKFAELHIYGAATKAFMDAGECYNALGPKEIGQSAAAGAFQSASLYADLAGETDTADVADRKAELIQVRTRLYEQFASFKPNLLPKGVEAMAAAEFIARYIVGDRALRDQVIEYRGVTKMPGETYPFPTLKQGWEGVVRDLLQEFRSAPAAAQDEVAGLRIFGAGRYSDAETERLFEETLRGWDALSQGERGAIAGEAALKNEAFIALQGRSIPSAWFVARMNALARGDLAEGLLGRRTPEEQAKKEEGRKALEKVDARK